MILGYLFPTFSAALTAMQELAASEYSVSVTRVSDANETQFSFAMRVMPTSTDKLQSRALRLFLSRKLGWDLNEMCLSFIGYEGSEQHVTAQRRAVGKLVKRHGGLCIGSGPGALYDQKKFDIPYIRDFLLDRGAAGDVSETATTWSNLKPLYEAVTTAANGAFAASASRAISCATCRTATTPGPACTSRSRSRRRPRQRWKPSTRSSSPRFSRRSSTTARRSRITTRSAPSTLRGSSRTSRLRRGDARGVVQRDRPGQHLNPGKIVGTNHRAGAPVRAARAD